jgi:Fe-S-cluster-containing hydrogenase component 2
MGEYQMDLKSVPTANGMSIACVHEEPTPCSAACTQRTLGEELSSTHFSTLPTAKGMSIACVHEEPTPCSTACTQRTLGEEFSSTHFSTLFHSTVQHFPPSIIYADEIPL